MRRITAFTPIILLGILLLIFGVMATIYRGPEPPQGFKDKVAAARSESERINFGDLLEEETLYHNIRRSKGYACSKGTYTSGEKANAGTWCMQGYVKYFGLKEFDTYRIDAVHNAMLELGWSLKISPEAFIAQKEIALTRKDRSGGFLYSNKSGLKANVSFAQRNSNWQDCDTRPLCRLAKEKSSEYQAIVSASASYEIRPDF